MPLRGIQKTGGALFAGFYLRFRSENPRCYIVPVLGVNTIVRVPRYFPAGCVSGKLAQRFISDGQQYTGMLISGKLTDFGAKAEVSIFEISPLVILLSGYPVKPKVT